jgi:hypothetical protein
MGVVGGDVRWSCGREEKKVSVKKSLRKMPKTPSHRLNC